MRKRLAPAGLGVEAFRAACPIPVEGHKARWAQRAGRFLAVPRPEDLAALADEPLWARHVTDVAEKALAGEYPMFSARYAPLGWPPDFNRDALNDVRWESGRPWWDGPDSLGGQADIKLVWEASRFSLAYTLARAYARDGGERWAQAFWQMFEAWVQQNPPERSVAWRCGQEMTFRLMAMLFAAVVTLPSQAATDRRLWALTCLAWQTGRHLAVNINAAQSQKNNHGISEAVGLWTIGLLFDELPQARAWRDRGRRILVGEMRRQVYDDGSFVQNSLNYHRVLMDDMLWAIRLGRLSDQPLPAEALDRFAAAGRWLEQMIDPVSGRVPNYGANDGAHVLPLACADYLDYRPVVQAAAYAARGTRALPTGPWDEKLLWLFGREAAAAPVEPVQRDALGSCPDGGYFLLRGGDSWCMTRCHSYRDRPGQTDMLHVDLWCGGVNVLRDGGSYLYNGPPGAWRHYFHSTAAHNTVEIDGADQMTKGPRFLWFHWTRSRVLALAGQGDVGFFRGEHYGFRRLGGAIHRRTLCRLRDTYVIVDEILASAWPHEVTLRWRLCPGPWRRTGNTWAADLGGRELALSLVVPPAMDIQFLSGQEEPRPEGWESLYYSTRTPVPVVRVGGMAQGPVCMVTIVGPAGDTTRCAGANPPLPGEPLVLTGLADAGLARAMEECSGGAIRAE